MTTTRKAKCTQTRSLVTERLERVSKDVFRKHFDLITSLIGSSHGVYALYDGPTLYYVGKSTDLKNRVRHHLKDRHYASWTHFSLYLVRNSEHIHEIESLLVRIANPEGNRVVPKGKSPGELLKRLKALVKKNQQDEFECMFGGRAAKNTARLPSQPTSLQGLVSKRTQLYRAYKGKEYTAYLSPNGVITLNGVKYTSPSGAAHAVLDKPRAVNGWTFWYIKDAHGDWVLLDEFRR